MSAMTRRFRSGLLFVGGAAALAVLLVDADVALAAKSPFGIATPDSTGPAFTGPLGGLFAAVAMYQAQFYQALTRALSAVKDSPDAALLLAGLSFLYGIFHAVGPGHGKAVITSYLIASRQTVRRGILISLAAAVLQGLVAIAIVVVASVIFRATAIGMTRATNWLEIVSYALVAGVGAWLLWNKLRHGGHAHAPAPTQDRHQGHDHDHDHDHGHDHNHDHVHAHGHDHGHEHGHHLDHGDACHSHAPDPALLDKPLTISRAWAATLAVGIRPCSGAIIVLVFALSQQLFLAGIAAVLAMSFGTFITVSALAVAAVSTKDLALRFAGLDTPAAERIMRVIEIGGAAFVLVFGLTLLGGALAGGFPG
jgi:nickel/cobalt transporter (NicO) family protein